MNLSNKRIVITRPPEKAYDFAEKLRAYGAIPIVFPTIEISSVQDTHQLDHALFHLDSYDWIVFTSTSAVDKIWERSKTLGIGAFPESLKVAAIGPKTAASLVDFGVQPDYVPDEFTAESILPGMGELDQRWVLLPLADIAHDDLPRAIQLAGGIAHVVVAYHTLPSCPDPAGFARLREGVDVVTFTSGSTVRNFIALVQQNGLDAHNLPGSPKFACIGPKTATTMQEVGLAVDVLAEKFTTEGIIEALIQYYKNNTG